MLYYHLTVFVERILNFEKCPSIHPTGNARILPILNRYPSGSGVESTSLQVVTALIEKLLKNFKAYRLIFPSANFSGNWLRFIRISLMPAFANAFLNTRRLKWL